MSKNILFNFVASHNPQLPNGETIVKTEDKIGNEYIRIDLKSTDLIQLSDYTLLTHHLSIYKIEVSDNDALSQYHYTAYFSGAQNNLYQLHVYFNRRDELTRTPIFSIQSIDGYKKQELDEGFNDDFADLALAATGTIIYSVKKQLKETVQRLEKDYQALELNAETIFKSSTSNSELYSNQLQKMQSVLEDLAGLVQHNHYLQTQQLLQTIQKSFVLTKINQIQITVKNDEIEEVEETNNQILIHLEKPHSKLMNKNTMIQNSAEESIDAIEEKLSTWTNQHKDWKNNKDSTVNILNLAEQLVNLFTQTNLLALERESTVPRLFNLHQKIHAAGKLLFALQLLKNDFESAKILQPFGYQLTQQLLEKALLTDNDKLLDHLFTQDNFIIHQFITLNNKQYSSPIAYCVAHSTNVNCLSVLMKHGGSLLSLDEQGLPVADVLLSNSKHPFAEVLITYKETTIHSVRFYKQVISLLEQCLKKGTFNNEKRSSIEAKIKQYTIEKQEALLISQAMSLPSGQQVHQQVSVFEKKHLDNILIQRVRADNEVRGVLGKIKLYSEVVLELLKKNDPKEYNKKKNQLNRVSSDTLENLDHLMTEYADIIDTICFDDLKKHVLSYLRSTVKFLENRIELEDTQQHLRRIQGQQKKKLNKQEKQWVQAESDLFNCINEYEKKYSFFLKADQSILPIDKIGKSLQEKFKSLVSYIEEMPEFNNLSEETKLLGRSFDTDAILKKHPELWTTASFFYNSIPKDRRSSDEEDFDPDIDFEKCASCD